MTSKESLETLFDLLCERDHTNSEHNFYLKLYETVKEDLDVLEILKRLLITSPYDAQETIGGALSFICGVTCDEEDDDLIREWLEK